jgi:transcriptional regulator ATRX
VHLFLISSKAGGIGITLTGANRVVLLDSHFNPTIMTQALYRCYRYGQEKPVYVYRLLAEGTGDEKIYSRSVNKQGLSLKVLDGKTINRHFSEKELCK